MLFTIEVITLIFFVPLLILYVIFEHGKISKKIKPMKFITLHFVIKLLLMITILTMLVSEILLGSLFLSIVWSIVFLEILIVVVIDFIKFKENKK